MFVMWEEGDAQSATACRVLSSSVQKTVLHFQGCNPARWHCDIRHAAIKPVMNHIIEEDTDLKLQPALALTDSLLNIMRKILAVVLFRKKKFHKVDSFSFHLLNRLLLCSVWPLTWDQCLGDYSLFHRFTLSNPISLHLNLNNLRPLHVH